MAFKKIEAQQLQGNPFEMIEKQAALFTAGTPGDFNTMTIGCGTAAILWNSPRKTTASPSAFSATRDPKPWRCWAPSRAGRWIR